MYPILLCGLLQCAASLRYALRPKAGGLKLPLALCALTLLWGATGFSLGMIYSLSAMGQVPPEQRFIVLIGLGECLNDVALALFLTVASATLVAIGVARQAPSPAREERVPLPIR
jgi:hypothetical protein